MSRVRWVVGMSLGILAFSMNATAAEPAINIPLNQPGRLPKDDAGRELNLNFETGDLRDWTATGTAFRGQPDRDGIDPKRPLAGAKKSLHTGRYWIGGFEIAGDQPQGTLSSAPFLVDADWCSFLVGGGNHRQTRTELVLAENNQVIATELGDNEEEMHPVVLNLAKYKGKKIFIRLVDEHSGGWGHVNFDDFRLSDEKPKFQNLPVPLARVFETNLYPYQNLSGDEAARVMQVPGGFRVQCAAHEPDVRQPIAMAIDDRGRVWIAEAYAYPQRDPQGTGRDRILIFEDADLDGILEKRTVFVEGLNLVSGLEIGFGGVFVGAAPYLLFIPDRNGNDVPDGLEPGAKPAPVDAGLQFPRDVPQGAEVLLDGWAWQDTHEILNSFIWGPDGWLYGCHGVFTHSLVGKPGTPENQRTPINAGIWRYHPVQQKFERFIEGTSNPWGVDFNEHGDAFCTACVIPHLYYLIPGGRYQRQAGNSFNPNTYREIQTIARHRHFVGNQWNQSDRQSSDDVGGGHAHAGAMIYQGAAWPAEYHGKLFMNNIHGNRINVDVLIPEGSGYAGDRNPDFLLTGDRWSQMINMRYGPDGQGWLIDWYDQEQCHRREEDVHDRSNGRIYRVSYGEAKPVRVDMQKHPSAELIKLAITSENAWYARHARRILQERAAAGETFSESGIRDIIENQKVELSTPSAMLRMMWLLNNTVGFEKLSRLTFDQLLAHVDPHVRSWCIRLLIQSEKDYIVPSGLLKKLEAMATTDASPIVRLELASAAVLMPYEDRWTLLENLVAHHSDAHDHNLPLLEWYAMEPLADVDPQRALALGMSAGKSIPLLRELMIRRLGSGRPEAALALLVQGLEKAQTDDVRLTFLKGMRGALAGVRDIQPPPGWDSLFSKLTHSDQASRNFDVYLYALGLGARFGNKTAGEDLERMIIDEAGPVTERRIALSFLVDDRNPRLPEILPSLLQGFSLRSEALKAAATLSDPRLAEVIIDTYKTLSPQEQADARNTLASRASYAIPFLEAVAANRIPRRDLSADLIRQLENLNQPEIHQGIEKVWGTVREFDGDGKARIAELIKFYEDPQLPSPNRESGRAIFFKTCQQCHTLFGSGGKIGPDITGSNRANIHYLLQNIIDPSAVMAKEYQPIVLATAGGRVVTGILKRETEHAVTLQTTNELVTIPKDEIDARKQSEKSMMPDGLLATLTPMQIRDLLAYLSGPSQVAMQAIPETLPLFFNGRDLTGWLASREDEQSLWHVENGELIGRSAGLEHDAFLVSELSIDNFRFRCEVKLVNEAGLAGIQFRSQPLENGEVRGILVGVGADQWGQLSEEAGRGLLARPQSRIEVNPDGWNTYEIVASGGRIRTFLNGRLCADFVDSQLPRTGEIALQLHSGSQAEVHFRNLQLELLTSLPPFAQNGSPPGQWPVSQPLSAGQKIDWKKITLDSGFRSEGCCVADFDNDGDLDIAAGAFWYEQPDASASGRWRPHAIVAEPKEFDPKSYSDSFLNFADDLNGDGWMDLIVVSYPGQETWWYANPGTPDRDGVWVRQLVIPVTNNESPRYLDLNRDGRRELISGVENKVIARSVPSSFPQAPWKMISISAAGAPGTDRYSHGIGAGDINGDGRADVVVTQGWWEQPDSPSRNAWKFHEAVLGQPCSQIFVHDFDADGDNDVLSSSAHRYGIWWHEQGTTRENDESEGTEWQEHLIDESISQTHAMVLADINGDGQPDFVTGRRHWAHNGRDPGEDQPAFTIWFELQQTSQGPNWTKHVVDDNSGVGTQFEVADVTGDGLLDIVTSSKKGTYLMQQLRN